MDPNKVRKIAPIPLVPILILNPLIRLLMVSNLVFHCTILALVCPKMKKNKSADAHPEIVRQKISTEIDSSRIAGPFVDRPISTLRVSPIGLVEKKHQASFA